jgi:hypothetical protein
MPANLFDVFVVGSTDPSAAGETRLAAALSAKHGVPLPTVAKAIAAKNLRAGQGLEQGQAQALVRQLQGMGAVTVIRSAVSRSPTQSNMRASGVHPVAFAPGPSVPRPPTPSPTGAWSGPPAGQSSTALPGFGMPVAAAADPFAPLTPPVVPVAQTGGRDPFQPRHVATPAISAKARTPPPPQHQSIPSSSGLELDVASAPKIELARKSLESTDELPAVPAPRAAMAPSSLREMDAGGASGVAMDEDPKNLNLVRCVQHGLFYDKTKASGCRKCMSGARDYANRMEKKSEGIRLGDFRGKPAKRAFLGLTLTLVLGFLPAAYYCFGPGTTETRRLRVEQEVLSRQPGTEDTLKVFDDLDLQVRTAHEKASRNTAIVWIAVTGVAMLGWYKIT